VSRADELRAELRSAQLRVAALEQLADSEGAVERAEYEAARSELQPYVALLERKLSARGEALMADLQRSRASHVAYMERMRSSSADATLEDYQREFAVAEVARASAFIEQLERDLMELGVTSFEGASPIDAARAELLARLDEADVEAYNAHHLACLLRLRLVRGDLSDLERAKMQRDLSVAEARHAEASARLDEWQAQLTAFDQG
jgi:hypothetical protein